MPSVYHKQLQRPQSSYKSSRRKDNLAGHSPRLCVGKASTTPLVAGCSSVCIVTFLVSGNRFCLPQPIVPQPDGRNSHPAPAQPAPRWLKPACGQGKPAESLVGDGRQCVLAQLLLSGAELIRRIVTPRHPPYPPSTIPISSTPTPNNRHTAPSIAASSAATSPPAAWRASNACTSAAISSRSLPSR